MMINSEQLKRRILSDMHVALKEEFDRNFERKAFFSDKWKKRANPNAKGSLLMVTGTLRRSIRSEVQGNWCWIAVYTAIYRQKPIRLY